MALTAVSFNLDKKLTDQAACDAVLGTLHSMAPDWAVAFFAECDAHRHADHMHDFGDHLCRRFWAGPGSFPFCVVIRRSRVHALRSVTQCGRACRVHFADGASLNKSFVFFHGAHGDDLPDSLSDAAFLVKTRSSRSQVVVMGDFNVDFLPAFSGDPFSDQPGRSARHFDNRLLLENFLESCRLELHTPTSCAGIPPGDIPVECVGVPITRVPIGDQPGLPSWIDHCASDGSVSDLAIHWPSDVPSDHAGIVARCPCVARLSRQRPRSTWACDDVSAADEAARALAAGMDSEGFDSVNRFHDFVLRLQAAAADPRPCSLRRRFREPPAIKELRQRRCQSACGVERAHLQQQIWTGRKQWLDSLRRIREQESFRRGKPIWKSRKLHTVKRMQAPGVDSDIHDQNEWARLIGAEYSSKWGCSDHVRHALLASETAEHHGHRLRITDSEVREAALSVRRRRTLDHYGCCALGVLLACRAAADAVATFFSRLATDPDALRTIEVHGRVLAKDAGAIPADRTRAILPLPVILVILDAIIAVRMHAVIDRLSATADPCFFECARKGRQVLDIVFPASLVVEKGLDMQSRACVAQADIRRYYDSLQPLMLSRWMIAEGFEIALAIAFLLLQLRPSIVLHVGQAEARISERTLGTLTGSRSASASGRIPLLDAALCRSSAWRLQGFSTEGFVCSLATYVDNLVSFGTSPEAAIGILSDCGEHLRRQWFLSFGPESMEYMTCRGYPDNIHVGDEWRQCSVLKCLGHHLDYDGSISTCLGFTIRSMWKAFWGNHTQGLISSPMPCKLRFLQGAIQSIASFRWSRWPFQKSAADKLDGVQRKMIYILARVRPRPTEDVAAFVQRRRSVAGGFIGTAGKWSLAWGQSLKSWYDHVDRRHDPWAWSWPLIHWHDDEWIQTQRAAASAQNESRTRTRAYRGKPNRRWTEGYRARPGQR